MNEPEVADTPANEPAPIPPAKDRVPKIALGLSSLAVLIVLAMAWFNSGRIEDTRAETARRLADSDTAQREAWVLTRQNRETLDALQTKVGVLEARLAEMQGQQLALETMYQELSRVRDDRLLAEIEQAVSIAAQQLQLAGNVEAALIALQGAESRLAKNAQPQFLNVRRLINRDIERLKALPSADVPGIALKIDSVLNAVSTLPLAFEQRPVPASADSGEKAAPVEARWQSMVLGWLTDVWREVRQLVHIERLDRPDPGLLAPRETYFLRENLRLRLLSARLALLSRDGRSFSADIAQAQEWLSRYFDVRAPGVLEAQRQLAWLARLEVARESVDLNETLSALRNFKLGRERGSVR